MNVRVTVVPLGPGDPSLLTLQSAETLRGGAPLFLRTERHPVSLWLREQGIPFSSFDALYDAFDTFEEMNRAIAERLLSAAGKGPVLYGVPDPLTDTSVALVLREAEAAGIQTAVLPGVSTADACLSACGDLTGEDGVLIQSAQEFLQSGYDPTRSLLITELDSPLLAGEVKLRLCEFDEESESEVGFLPPSEKARRSAQRIPLQELDRMKHYNQTAAVFVPGRDYLHRRRFVFRDLEEIMTRLRSRDGCPWDGEQTHESLRPYLVEEAWEAVDAINQEDMDHLSDELGDVLLQVVFHASIGESFDEFTMTDVVTHICRKMIIRHPRLFPKAAVLPSQPEAVDSVLDWEKIKRQETGSKTVGESLNDVSPTLPALKYASKMHRKLDQWPGCRRSLTEIAAEIRELSGGLIRGDKLQEDALADLLLSIADLCHLGEADGEILLHGAAEALKRKWQEAEKAILRDGKKPEALSKDKLQACIKAASEKK